MITTKEILISKGYPDDEAEEMAKEIDEVVNKSYMVAIMGFSAFRDIIIKAMFWS